MGGVTGGDGEDAEETVAAVNQEDLTADVEERISTGIPGLDNVLCGGVDAERLYLVEGEPGTGKTTLGLRFLLEGARRGEKGLYVTLSESERELRLVAKRHGFSLDKLSIFELVPPEASLDPERELTLFHPAELELTETSKLIFDRVNDIMPPLWSLRRHFFEAALKLLRNGLPINLHGQTFPSSSLQVVPLRLLPMPTGCACSRASAMFRCSSGP